jgi:hypothetical protein
MPDLVNVTYAQTGQSLTTDHMGMREMQARAFEARNAQYLLLKVPPASGKSRALMFLGLDKLYNQELKRVIVAVPERSIGGSFDCTDLTSHGFFADWDFNSDYNLCTPGGDVSKVSAFKDFLNDSSATILISRTSRKQGHQRTKTLQSIEGFKGKTGESCRLGSV